MGITLRGKTGNGYLDFHVNHAGLNTLAWLCWGIKEKAGVYPPMSREECRIVARLLRNKAGMLETWRADTGHAIQEYLGLYVFSNGGKDYLNDEETVSWIRDVARFFESIEELVEDD